MGAIYGLTLRQLTGRWRLIIMTVLAALPVIIAWMMLDSSDAPTVQEFETAVLGAMLAGSITPLVVLAIGAAAFSNEVEDRTLANLTLSPVQRWQIVLPKLLGSITIAAPFIAASAFLTSGIAFLGDPAAVTAVTVSAVAGVVLYASAFTFLGLLTTHAIGIGLLYIVLWEGFFAGYVQGVRLLSIRHYAISLMHGFDERRFAFMNHPGLPAVLIVVSLVAGGFFWLAVRRLRRMDVP